MADITDHEEVQIDEANASGRTPVVFVHGLWLLPSSWDRWRDGVRGGGLHHADARAGPTTRTRSPRPTPIRRCSPTRPSARSPTTSRRSSAGSTRKPAIVGHSFGGLLTQILAGRGLSAVVGRHRPGAVPRRAAAADLGAQVGLAGAAATRPTTAARSRSPTTSSGSPSPTRSARTRPRSSTTTYAVPASGAPLFQAATANLNPWTEAKVDYQEPRPRAAAHHLGREGQHRALGHRQRLVQAAEAQRRGHRDRRDARARGHSLTIDSGWRDVADTALSLRAALHPALTLGAAEGCEAWTSSSRASRPP